ncbi:MAG: DUF3307 domain-containing protein [Cyclobacteriaceae bacterium]|nr:DUF3307 domain-containing protein [Cyclobacteriaceae bacterium]
MILLLIKLLIAHSVGDFVLQPKKWVEDKKQKKHKSVFLYIHILIHTLTLAAILKFDWNYWLVYAIIPVSHYMIDLIKVNLENRNNSKALFVLDQLAHLVIISLFVFIYEPYRFDLTFLYSFKSLLLALALISITSIASVVMKLIMSHWEVEGNNESLENAGNYIGILERLFVFGFIVLNQWQAIGLLIAAKSVFRFGDLSKARDRKLTEYILIGTLLSFGMAILIGTLYTYAVETLAK